MRPIDADKLKERLRARYNYENKNPVVESFLSMFLALIDTEPVIPQPPNDPLTLEELREMDSPVWCFVPNCDWIPDRGYWCLCRHGEIVAPNGNLFEIDEIPDWIFYRRRPEEGIA